MSLVVSDASPLINLARVGCFDLLAAFYTRIVIPQAVYEEVVVRGEGRDGSHEVHNADWIDVQATRDELAVQALAAELGMGESSAIVLAKELNASILLMDEIRGRRVAQQLGLRMLGTIGILARAQREAQITSLREVLDLLRERGTWIDQTLYEGVLHLVGE